MFDKDFIKRSNLKRYKRYFKTTNDYDWVVKYAREMTEENSLENLDLENPSVKNFIKSLGAGNAQPDQDKVQAMLGKIVAFGLSRHYRETLDRNLPALQTWKYQDPDAALEEYLTEVRDSVSLESIRKLMAPALAKLKDKDAKVAKSVISDDQKLRNLIRYSIIRGYHDLYEYFLFKNPVVGFLPQDMQKSNKALPLSFRQAAGGRKKFKGRVEQKKDFILRTTIGPRLDDYEIGLRIGMAKAMKALAAAKASGVGIAKARKSVGLFSGYINHANLGLDALQGQMKSPEKRDLKYGWQANSDYVTDNPYVANIDGIYSYFGLGEFLRKKISQKRSKKAITYTNWKGDVDYWQQPEPSGVMVSKHYVENVIAKPGFSNNLCLEAIASIAFENEYMSTIPGGDPGIVKFMHRGTKDVVSIDEVKELYKEFRRYIAKALHSLASELSSDADPYAAYENRVEQIKRAIITQNTNIIKEGQEGMAFRAGVNGLLPNTLTHIQDLGSPGILYKLAPDGTVKSNISSNDASAWKKSEVGARSIPDILKTAYFSGKYVKNQEEYDKWKSSVDSSDYLVEIEEGLPQVTDEFLTNLGIKPVTGMYDKEFLESVREFFVSHRTLKEVADAVAPIHHSAFFLRLSKQFLISFGEDMQFLVGIKYHNDRVQGGEESIVRTYDPRVGIVHGGDVDIDEEGETAQAVKNVSSRMGRKGLGNMELRQKILSNPDRDISLVQQAIQTGDVATYFEQLETEVRPAKLLHKKLKIRTLDTQSAGGIFEKIFFDQDEDTWKSIDDDMGRFYNWITHRYRYSMGKHTWDRNRSQLTEMWNSGRKDAPTSKYDFMEMIGAFADPFTYKNKEASENETAELAMWRATSKLGMIPDHKIISSYRNYFESMRKGYIGQSSNLESLIVAFSMKHKDATNDPFEKHPEVLTIKKEINKRLKSTGAEFGPKDWIKLLLGELDPNGELGDIASEFQPSFDPQDDEHYKDVFFIKSSNDVGEFFANIPSYVLTGEERVLLANVVEKNFPEEAYINTSTFVGHLFKTLQTIEIELENPEELYDFLGYLSEIRYTEVVKDETEASPQTQFLDESKDYLERVSKYYGVQFDTGTAKSILAQYLKDVLSLIAEGDELVDLGDKLLNDNPELLSELGDIVGELDDSALPKLMEMQEALTETIEQAKDVSELPLSRVQIEREEVSKEEIAEDEEEIFIELEEDELPFADPDEVEEIPFAKEEDVISLDKSPAPVDLPPLGPFVPQAMKLKALVHREDIQEADTSGQVISNALDYASRLLAVKEEDIVGKGAAGMLANQLDAFLENVTPSNFTGWFGENRYDSALIFLNAVIGADKKIQSFLNIDKILSSEAGSPRMTGEFDDGDSFYHF